MKRFNTLILGFATLAMLASCKGLNEMPEFEASESFASFPTASFSLDENKGQVVIPVEVASISPVKTVVSYKVVDGTAKAGVDYKDTNADAVLTFDGEKRSQNIVLDIIPRVGEYTGDLMFSIELISATGLKLSRENVCTVTIQDLDHPLAPILGDYAGSAESSYDGPVSWTMTLLKDASDVTMVWIKGLTNELVGDADVFYATVNYDDSGNITGFTIPAGQYTLYSSYHLLLVGNTAGSGTYFPNAPLTWAFKDGKFTFVAEEGGPNSIGILAVSQSDHTSIAGWYNRYNVPPSFVKL